MVLPSEVGFIHPPMSPQHETMHSHCRSLCTPNSSRFCTKRVYSTGETIPIRLFLGGFDLTPTFRDVNKKFSVRYYLNLVLIDEENRRYFKQQEITVFRVPEVSISCSVQSSSNHCLEFSELSNRDLFFICTPVLVVVTHLVYWDRG